MWHKINLKFLVIVTVVVAMSVFVVSNIAAQDASIPGGEIPVQVASETPLPTDAPTATLTELPTATPTVQPTATAMPTIAPTATATVAPAQNNNSANEGPTATVTPSPTVVPTTSAVAKLTVTKSEPAAITAGQNGNISIIGTNFTANTTVRLVGYGFLSATLVNSGALTASIPNALPAGTYTIQVSDPSNGTANSPTALTVNAAAVETTPVPTSTPIPGQPQLAVSNFSANPATILPGGTTQLTFSVVNVGSRTAEGVVISLGDTKFTPANGQSSLTLPDLPAGGAYTVTLSATAPSDAAEGPQSIAIVLTSRDFSGQTYTDNGTLSVMVAAKNEGESQIVLDSYDVTPKTAAPGDQVTVKALFKNTGTQTASQVLVQLDSSSGLLLAGSSGNAFSLGDMEPGASVPLVMSLVVSSDAKAGAQAQAFNITYLQDDTDKQSTASISLDVEDMVEATPLILMQSYSVGSDDEVLQPEEKFTFSMTVQNAGTVDVSDMLVTFGTVSSNSSSSSTTASSTETANSTSTTTNSDSFSIYGSGGTLLVGALAAGKQATVTQEFIVNSDLTSGIHDLPITLQYQLTDGTIKQQTLDATLFVVVPASIRITSTKTVDDPLTAKSSATLSLKVANIGDSQVNLTDMKVTGDNATITSGAEAALDPLSASDDVTKTVTFSPDAVGDYTINVAVSYTDDMSRTQTVTQTYSGTVKAAATQQTNAGQTFQRTAAQSQTSQNELGRLLLGFLGFGG